MLTEPRVRYILFREDPKVLAPIESFVIEELRGFAGFLSFVVTTGQLPHDHGECPEPLRNVMAYTLARLTA